VTRRLAIVFLVLLAVSVLLGVLPGKVGSIWPPVAALAVIMLTRQALLGLLAGSLAGAIVLAGGNPLAAVIHLMPDHLLPGLTSPWKLGALVFTLILGGFAAVLESGGGFTRLLTRASGGGDDRARRLETAATGLGILCFFDGLANSMVVGRVSRGLADRAGVSRVKLAYITDTTSSAVACLAFISTWIAFQLTMIDQAFLQAGRQVNPYLIFLKSVPLNFYCWFTLVMLLVAVRRRFHPGPMAGFVADVQPVANLEPTGDAGGNGSIASALVPLGVLLAAFFAGFLVLGSPHPVLPLTREKLVAAFGSDAGPLVMVLAAVTASLAAAVLHPGPGIGRLKPAARAWAGGARSMILPLLILLAAWMLGSVINALGTAALITSLAERTASPAVMPAVVFVTGAVVSFATGTSWGTMGLLFPLAVPAAAALGASDPQLHLVVAAVFSGAVFGDHCSPFSDTTIVTSISCGVEAHDHVRTQIPYALLTAAVAVGLGFLPAGFGVPGPILLAAGTVFILLLPRLMSRPS
jgi:tetracycline resistance efflux pump